MSVIDVLKNFVNDLNKTGIPLPLIRLEGKPTFTGTMTFLSFNTALLGQISKLAGFLGGIDLTQANYLFLICLGAYLGRKLQTNGTTKSVDMGDQSSPPPMSSQ